MPTKFPGRKNQHEFFRQWRRGEASLFSSATGSSNGPRGLIICVKGNSRRMMMPMPTWLSNLPGEDHDVLALGCPPHKMFVDGVRGFSKTLPETLEAIDVFVAENGYTDVWVMGSSGGTLPALFAGLRIGAKGIFLAGVVDPDVDNWRGFLPRGELARRVGEAVDTAPRHPTEIVLAYGADDEPDTVLAQRLAELVPNARLMPVAHTTHNCLYPLAKRRQLAGILRDFLS